MRPAKTLEVIRQKDGTWTANKGRLVYSGEDAEVLDKLFKRGKYEETSNELI